MTDRLETKKATPLGRPRLVCYAARGLARMPPSEGEDVVVPALAQYLERTNTTATSRVSVATSLAWFGERAVPGLPQLTNALSDPDPIVRQNVAGAIKQIHYQMRKK